MSLQKESRTRQKKASTTESISAKRKKKTIFPYKVVSVLSVFLFITLAVYMAYFQIYKSEELLNSPYNKREEAQQAKVRRGSVFDRNGNVLAYTETDENGAETRIYPYGRIFAHTVGYLVYGSSGLESSQNHNLLTSHSKIRDKISNQLNEEKLEGDDLYTTLDAELQEAAYDALGDYDGAVIVMDVSTGAVLADVSKPAFDPNTITEDWDYLVSEENEQSGIFVNRVTQGLYPPGSTFKIVTALAYLKQFGSFDGFSYDCSGSYEHSDFTIHCAGNADHGEEDFADAMANSCNCAFAYMAAELIDRDILAETAEQLFFNHDAELPVPSVISRFTLNRSSADQLTMQTGIGQGNTLATPMEMCMIAQAAANNGNMLLPNFLGRIESSSGKTVKNFFPTVVGQVMTADQASELKDIMREVVERGTASSLNDLPYNIAGKTGTAQYGDIENNTSHSWFTGFSDVGSEDIAVCVLIEDGGTYSNPAYETAKTVFRKYFE